MSIFNRENFNFGGTSYYKRIPKGEDIPISICDGIQIETIYSGNEPVEVRLSVPEKDIQIQSNSISQKLQRG